MDQPVRKPCGPMKTESRSRGWRGVGSESSTAGCGSIDAPQHKRVLTPDEDRRKGTHQHNQFEGPNAAAPAANMRPGPCGVYATRLRLLLSGLAGDLEVILYAEDSGNSVGLNVSDFL